MDIPSIPKSELRVNCNYHLYSHIAIESYYNAKQSMEKSFKDIFALVEHKYEFEKNIVSSIIFSAMALESFFNDYAAACMGDDPFYDNYDRLSAIGKFQLISQFILKKEIDKSQFYYCGLKQVFKQRDELVHNKGKAFHVNDEWNEGSYNSYVEHIGKIEEVSEYEKQEMKNNLKDALDGIKTLKSIADFFDTNDKTAYADFKLLNYCGSLREDPDYEYLHKVWKEIGLD